LNLERYIKGVDGRIRLRDERLEIRRYGFLERFNNEFGRNYPQDSFLALADIKRVLFIDWQGAALILRIESVEALKQKFPRNSEKNHEHSGEALVTRECSIVFPIEDRSSLTSFFDELKALFTAKGFQVEFESLSGLESVRKDYEPPLQYYPGQKGETGFKKSANPVVPLHTSAGMSSFSLGEGLQIPAIPVTEDEVDQMKTLCPYCHHELTVTDDILGLNCPACDSRVIIRHGKLLTIEQAKIQTSQLQQGKPAHQTMSAITKETFDPKTHVAEYKRVCNQCHKIWHSLASREGALQDDVANNNCSSCGDDRQRAQYKRNVQATQTTLSQLKSCPECGSAHYTETTLYYDK
jgi:uncharacterized protein YbaR (Trm112 family)